MSDAITLSNVSKTYRLWHERNNSLKSFFIRRREGRWDDLRVLDDVSFSIPEGTTFGLLGSNGAGKSTTLKLLARIIVPDEGSVVVDGKVSALLELGAGFHPELSGRENIFMNGAILGLSKRMLNERFDEIVEFSGLGDFIDNQVKTYSSGMYARLGFAVAVNVDPDVLLIDEVLAVGDSAFQRKCHMKISELRSTGRTVVIVSHDLGSIRNLCDSVAWIDHGRLQEVGPAADVIDRYLAFTSPDTVIDEHGRARLGSGVVRIEGVDVSGPDGDDYVVTGGPFRLRFRIAPTDHNGPIVVGLGLQASTGIFLAGSITSTLSLLAGPLPHGAVVEYSGDRFPLRPDAYALTTSAHSADMAELYDQVEQMVIEVQGGDDHTATAMVSLGGTWSRP